MPKITDEELVMISVRIFKADQDRLRSIFGARKVNSAIRTIVRSFLNQTEERMRKAVDEAERKYSP